jgi:hypothetical protein
MSSDSQSRGWHFFHRMDVVRGEAGRTGLVLEAGALYASIRWFDTGEVTSVEQHDPTVWITGEKEEAA